VGPGVGVDDVEKRKLLTASGPLGRCTDCAPGSIISAKSDSKLIHFLADSSAVKTEVTCCTTASVEFQRTETTYTSSSGVEGW
jgi:hypothetical protein